jgi:enamine deaminase RidA (YjgF/YER057c/UK114 family)
MTIRAKFLQPDTLPPSAALGFTQVVRVGDWVYVAGQTAVDQTGNVVGVNDAAAQTEKIFENMTHAMEAVGGTLNDIVKTVVYVVGEANLDAIRAARAGRFGDTPPANTLVVVSRLARPEFILEIEAVAYVEAD